MNIFQLAGFKKIVLGKDILSARLSRQFFPFLVQIAVTNRCNSRCDYCNYYNRPPKEFSSSDLFRLIDELSYLGTKRISLVGGEPLLRDDIPEIIEYSNKRQISCSLVSNGYLVPRYIENLRNLSSLVLSIDGPEDVHDINREKGSFQKAMVALKLASERGIPVYLSTVLTKHNASEESIDFLVRLAREYKIKVGIIILQNVMETTGNVSQILAGDNQYRVAIQKIIREIDNGAPILFSKKSYEHVLRWPNYSKVRLNKKDQEVHQVNGPKCWGGRFFCNIDSNGDVYPCCLTIGSLKPLNFLENGFEKSWEHIQQHSCRTCMSPGWTDYNYVFSLDPQVLWHHIRTPIV